MKNTVCFICIAAALSAVAANAEYFTLRPEGDRAGSCGLSCSIDACHYCLIDETPALDGDYVYSGSPSYACDIYDLTDHSTRTGAITGVEIFYRAKATGTGGNAKSILMAPDGHRYYGAEKKLTDAWALYSDAWAGNPFTGKPWQWGEIDALQVGIDLRTLGGPRDAVGSRCSQFYVVVTFDPSTPAAPPPQT